jgi:hypothetical protein
LPVISEMGTVGDAGLCRMAKLQEPRSTCKLVIISSHVADQLDAGQYSVDVSVRD